MAGWLCALQGYRGVPKFKHCRGAVIYWCVLTWQLGLGADQASCVCVAGYEKMPNYEHYMVQFLRSICFPAEQQLPAS